ncbi:phospho-sugar mutase [Ureaplasma canigenitalium]|uniref:phospho-sugar mutase n=1 Tax=Ureaplasma canigenitalium TaxID=42092 RepID=UPI000B2907B1|nr:phospho-sugar mutase [Ureaplasma canigenitalium]
MSNELFLAFLSSKNIAEEIKEKYRNLSIEEINELFNPDGKLKFGTAGIRRPWKEGTINLNKTTYTQLIIGYIRYLESTNPTNKLVVFGRDNRYQMKEMMEYGAEIFSSFGYRVLYPKDYSMLSTPIVSFLIKHHNACGGIMFTASHNPKTDAGYKVYLKNGAQPLPVVTNQIESNFPTYLEALEMTFKKDASLIRSFSSSEINEYFTQIKTKLIKTNPNKKKMYPVTFSGHHGTTTIDMIPFLTSLGYNIVDVKEQNFEDKFFVNDDFGSNPEDPKSFNLSVKYADKEKANVMISSDPDGDRMAIAIRHHGEWVYLNGNQTGIISAYYLLHTRTYQKPKYIISTYISTTYCDLFKEKYNVDVLYTDVGFKNHGNIAAELSGKKDLVIAFEEAIGALPSDINNDKDSYQYASILLEMIEYYHASNKTLVDVLYDDIFNHFGYWISKTTSFKIAGDDWRVKANALMDKMKNFEHKKINDFEIKSIEYHDIGKYLTFNLENKSSIKFRLSGTEPKLKIYIELYDFKVKDKEHFTKEYEKKMDDLLIYLKSYMGLN